MFDVVVVGAGVIGLTSAVRLREAGARVALVAADPPAETVSAVAAAVWYPTRTDPDPRVLAWAGQTYDELARQAAAGVPGVVMRRTRMAVQPSDDPWWAQVVPHFEDHGREWRFTVPTVEMGPYLEWLVARLAGGGVSLERRRLRDLAEAAELAPVVVNATGLAAGELCADAAVVPARGRVVLVANPGIETSVRDEHHPAGMVYVHPRSRDVVLGGTFEPGEWDTGPDPRAAAQIVARCTELVPELAGAPVLGERAGLRPVRRGGPRVGLDPALLPGGARMIHNYGHGGAGVTLSWGCAASVLVDFGP
ncbi:FAD-dependent oxidoreductase [Phytohabitans sp. ZYX-F-186]|uniref:D-amino-acid oxidase n=1 Tax=Phytohabitans maris TaxID=3071409 RepID=A0ABU0ZBA8_9ACTN|nr:FAD-dependent oxidoreductase [Phytohabitans sp. ZYX-F-186]MDQ7904351.1 FAD-dependent oxidoreductase [Phytohabitans sp. ZYX-F-186]